MVQIILQMRESPEEVKLSQVIVEQIIFGSLEYILINYILILAPINQLYI